MRNHCSSPIVSEFYEFGKPGDWCYDAMVDAVKLRYRLLPYIYSMAGDCVQNSGTMMRALVMDYTADKKASRLLLPVSFCFLSTARLMPLPFALLLPL